MTERVVCKVLFFVILLRYALRMTSRLLIFGFIFVTFVTARAYFAFMRMVYCIAANAACVFKVRAIPVYMVNGTLFGKIANGAFAQRNSPVFYALNLFMTVSVLNSRNSGFLFKGFHKMYGVLKTAGKCHGRYRQVGGFQQLAGIHNAFFYNVIYKR